MVYVVNHHYHPIWDFIEAADALYFPRHKSSADLNLSH